MSELTNYNDTGEHLPEFMRDFHDQKDLFKTIYHMWQDEKENNPLNDIAWTDAHVFTIDYFLWWMGLHGYKLQKNRKQNIKFLNPLQTIKECMKERNDKLSLAFKPPEGKA